MQQQPLDDEMASEMLQQLEMMRQADPAQYAELMELLQQASEATADAQSPSTQPMNAGDVAAAVSQLRSGGRSLDSLNLPGGKASLTTEGVKQQSKGIRITPTPGFVVKTRLQSQPTKVFINVCKHEQLAEPATKKKLDDDGNEVEGLNIPISLGPERGAEDKAGAPSKVFDVVVNPKVVQDCIEDTTGAFRDFVCHLAIQYIEQKYKLSLESKYKLPKITYKGDKVEDQFIQDRSHIPAIQEVSQTTSAAPKPAAAKQKQGSKVLAVKSLQPSFRWGFSNGDLEAIPEDVMNGDPLLLLHDGITSIQCNAPVDCDRLDQIAVKASAFKLSIAVEGYRQYSTLLPFCIQPSQVVARMTNDRNLEVACTIDHTPFEDGPDPGSNQWLLREAIQQETAALQKHKDADSPRRQGVEDMFHLKATDDSKLQQDSQMQNSLDVLPEDAFHAKDIMSQHIIQQREQSVQQKRDTYEKERQEWKQDPNVEFIDFAKPVDSKPVTEPNKPEPAPTKPTKSENELNEASSTIASRVLQQDQAASSSQPIRLSSLSSSTWTELLD